jgi:hypothetical protein
VRYQIVQVQLLLEVKISKSSFLEKLVMDLVETPS